MKEIKNYKSSKNFVNHGICATFEYDGQEYYADLCIVPDLNVSECMIFKAKNGKVTDWGELYCERGIPVDEEELYRCVAEFVAHNVDLDEDD